MYVTFYSSKYGRLPENVCAGYIGFSMDVGKCTFLTIYKGLNCSNASLQVLQ